MPVPSVETTPQATAEPSANLAPEVSGAARIVDASPGVGAMVGSAWRGRALLPRLGARVLIKKIVGTKLGKVWLVLRPVMDTLGKALIFGGLLAVGAPEGLPYFVFLLGGLLAWRLFDRSVFYATRSFDVYRKIMKELDIPLLLVPIAATAFPAVEISVYAAVFLGAIAFFWAVSGEMYLNLSPSLLLAPVGFAIMLATAFGLGLWTSVLNGKARDTRLTMRYVLEFWLYLTPVIYPLTAVPPSYRWLATINPMTAPVEMVKEGLLGVGGGVGALPLAWSLVFTFLAVASGLWFFNREAWKSVDLHGPDDDEDEYEEAR